MKFTTAFILFITMAFNLSAQIIVSSEYIAPASYHDINGKKTGAKSDAQVYTLAFQLPVSYTEDSLKRPTIWFLSMASSYTLFNIKNAATDIGPSELGNLIMSVDHLRPISKKWSLYASLGLGAYADHAQFKKLRSNNFMVNANAVFIMQVLPNLQIGAGLAFDSSFGYPMAYPIFYVDFSVAGKYYLYFNQGGLKTGIKMNKYINLNLVGTMKGSTGFMKRDEKKMQFSHMYVVGGIQPEFTFGKIKIPITFGLSCVRPAYYEERTIKDFWKVYTRDKDPYYSISPYGAIAIKYTY